MEARVATEADFEELIRMGAVMLSSMGIELYASKDSEPLYASLGFAEPERAWLRLRLAP